MLAQLFINNIAVIERASIDLEKGFTVLTGETGAGKSIIIDAIHAVLGERTSKELVRTGTQSASVSALFTGLDEDILRLLDQLSILGRRTAPFWFNGDIRQGGRSSCKLNGAPATVSMLKQVGPRLVTIHGQHESYELLSPEVHMVYLDSFAGLESLLAEYQAAYHTCGKPSGSWRPCRRTKGRRHGSPTCSITKLTRSSPPMCVWESGKNWKRSGR